MELGFINKEWEKFIEERKRYEEKVKLFDALIKIDGEEWRVMVGDLNEKEYEDRQKRAKGMEKEEQEDWDKVCNQQMKEWKKLIEEKKL